MRYLLDTNILVYYLRQDEKWGKMKQEYDLDTAQNFISVVTLGEIYSLALQNNWGQNRLKRIAELAQAFVVTDIYVATLIQRYAEIDTFSQGKLKNRPLNLSSRNMGKNDLWIAATASILNITLLTTDQDFNHLDNIFLSLKVATV